MARTNSILNDMEHKVIRKTEDGSDVFRLSYHTDDHEHPIEVEGTDLLCLEKRAKSIADMRNKTKQEKVVSSITT